jgi:uncharacterized protein YjbI with pentapeptide repeats
MPDNADRGIECHGEANTLRQILRWRPNRSQVLWGIGMVVVVVILAGAIGPVSRYATRQPQNATFVTALIALFGILVTQIVNTAIARSGYKHQREIENQRAQGDALQTYLEKMGELLTDKKLRTSPEDDVRTLARAQTLTVLERLDPTRKRILLQYLYEANLIDQRNPIISLKGANLREADLRNVTMTYADLSVADLRNADLRSANLYEANLRSANLSNANLSGAKLGSAHLGNANLSRANLSDAKLGEADFDYATLRWADLREAYLRGAILTVSQLFEANLSEADLSEANLTLAHLDGADLGGAKLSEADFASVDLTGARGLTDEHVRQMKGDDQTRLPDHLQIPEEWRNRITYYE